MLKLFIATAMLAASCIGGQAQTIHVLAFGQSNMEGMYGPVPTSSLPPNPDVRVWDWSTDEWRIAKLGLSPFHKVWTTKKPANNLAYVFVQKLAASCGVKVDLTFLASGGKRIEYFLPDSILRAHGWENHQSSKQFGTSLSDEIMGDDGDGRKALASSGADGYDIVLYHQGEANSLADGDEPGVYEAKLQALFTALQRRGLTTAATKIILGTINPGYPRAENQAEAVNMMRSSNVGVAQWAPLPTMAAVLHTDNRHATGFGLEVLGQRYFEQYLILEKGCPVPMVSASTAQG